MVVAVVESDALRGRVHPAYRIGLGEAYLPVPARVNDQQIRAEPGVAGGADLGGRPFLTLAVEIEGRLMKRIGSADAREVGLQQCRHREWRADRHHPRGAQPRFDCLGCDQGTGGMTENDLDTLVTIVCGQYARLRRET